MFGYALIRAITGAASPGRKRRDVLPGGWSRRRRGRSSGWTGSRIDRSPSDHRVRRLAVSRWIEDSTGWSIKKFVRTARAHPIVAGAGAGGDRTLGAIRPGSCSSAVRPAVREMWDLGVLFTDARGSGDFACRRTKSAAAGCRAAAGPARSGERVLAVAPAVRLRTRPGADGEGEPESAVRDTRVGRKF
jgi:hypothetical protein